MLNKNKWLIPVTVVAVGLALGYLTTTGTKSQWIRLIDIFIIGPLMIWLGWCAWLEGYGLWALAVVFFGSTTITYNLRNYLHQMKW